MVRGERDRSQRDLRSRCCYLQAALTKESVQVLAPSYTDPSQKAGLAQHTRIAEPQVRTHTPPVESPRLAGFCPPTARSRLFARVYGPGRCSGVSRDGYRAVHGARMRAARFGGEPVDQGPARGGVQRRCSFPRAAHRLAGRQGIESADRRLIADLEGDFAAQNVGHLALSRRRWNVVSVPARGVSPNSIMLSPMWPASSSLSAAGALVNCD